MYILLILFMLISNVSQADVFILTAPDKSVVGLSEQNDMFVPAGYKKDIIKNKKISDLTVSMGEEKLYDFDGGKFKINPKKVQDRNKEDQDRILKEQKYLNARTNLIDKLRNLKLTDEEIDILIR